MENSKSTHIQNHSQKKEKSETFVLGWLDPRNNKVIHAGISFYNPVYGEYLLKIDEDPREKQYFLKAFESDGQGSISYRMELAVKNSSGKFLKRQLVGHGYRNPEETQGNVFINYGSKFKTLVLYLRTIK